MVGVQSATVARCGVSPFYVARFRCGTDRDVYSNMARSHVFGGRSGGKRAQTGTLADGDREEKSDPRIGGKSSIVDDDGDR